jgi:uncharacterized membrane protein YqjE
VSVLEELLELLSGLAVLVAGVLLMALMIAVTVAPADTSVLLGLMTPEQAAAYR